MKFAKNSAGKLLNEMNGALLSRSAVSSPDLQQNKERRLLNKPESRKSSLKTRRKIGKERMAWHRRERLSIRKFICPTH